MWITTVHHQCLLLSSHMLATAMVVNNSEFAWDKEYWPVKTAREYKKDVDEDGNEIKPTEDEEPPHSRRKSKKKST
jgi:hypothetical protein